MRRPVLLLSVVAVLVLAAGSSPAAAAPAPSCDPIQTPPVFTGQAPTAESVLGFALGSQEVTAAQADAYVQAVDAASTRVVSGVLGSSWQGRPLRYALVGRPEHVTPAGLAAIQDATARLRDPDTPPGEAARLAATTPEEYDDCDRHDQDDRDQQEREKTGHGHSKRGAGAPEAWMLAPEVLGAPRTNVLFVRAPQPFADEAPDGRLRRPGVATRSGRRDGRRWRDRPPLCPGAWPRRSRPPGRRPSLRG